MKAIAKRVWVNNGRHDVGLLAAGVAFYAFLSFVPLLAALVMTYGLFADASAVSEHMTIVTELVPVDAARLIQDQLAQLTESASGRKGLALAIALLVSLYGASRASGAMIKSLNIIYEERDRRGYLRWTLLSAALSTSAVVIGILGIFAASMLSLAGPLIAAVGSLGAIILQIITWLVAGVLCSISIGAMYRFAPNRTDARWEWLSIGSMLATLFWLLATICFGIYAARFGDYNATYGSLGAVVIMMMWLYLSAYAILLGGLINAETERQTASDTTTGPDKPIGDRGAAMADTSAALE